MFYCQHHIANLCAVTIVPCLLLTLSAFGQPTKIVYSFPSAGPGGSGAKSSSSSSQYVGVVKKRENHPGFEPEENFGPVKGGHHHGSGAGGGSPAYSASSFSGGGHGGITGGFSTHIKHDVPPKRANGDSPSPSSQLYHRTSGATAAATGSGGAEPEFFFSSSPGSEAERPEPSRLFASYFSQPEASPLVGDLNLGRNEEAASGGASNIDENRLEEIRKHMEEADEAASGASKRDAFDNDDDDEHGHRMMRPDGERPMSYSVDERRETIENQGHSHHDEDEDDDDDGNDEGCKNCNYQQIQIDH